MGWELRSHTLRTFANLVKWVFLIRPFGVGYNPFRKQQRSVADYVMVAAAVVVTVALVLWALVL